MIFIFQILLYLLILITTSCILIIRIDQSDINMNNIIFITFSSIWEGIKRGQYKLKHNTISIYQYRNVYRE